MTGNCVGVDRGQGWDNLCMAWLLPVAVERLHSGDLHVVALGEGLWAFVTPVKGWEWIISSLYGWFAFCSSTTNEPQQYFLQNPIQNYIHKLFCNRRIIFRLSCLVTKALYLSFESY